MLEVCSVVLNILCQIVVFSFQVFFLQNEVWMKEVLYE